MALLDVSLRSPCGLLGLVGHVGQVVTKRNKIKQLCCGTVNPINASSWDGLRRAQVAFDQHSVEMLMLRCTCY